MIIEQMLEQLSTLGRRRTDRAIWESVLYYYGSILLNKYQFRKQLVLAKSSTTQSSLPPQVLVKAGLFIKLKSSSISKPMQKS